jgi:hypothetical protein
MPEFIGDAIGDVLDFGGDVISGVGDVIGDVAGGVGDVLGSIADVPVLGDVASMAANFFVPGSGFVLDQFGEDSIFNGGGIGSLIGDIGSSFGMPGGTSGSGSLMNSFMPGESAGMIGGIPSLGGYVGSMLGLDQSDIDFAGKLFNAGSSIYQAFNQPSTQSPQAAQNRTDPYAPYRQEAATKLNALMKDPSMVYGMPGYNFAQQQGAKQITRSNAATGNLASGSTLASLQQQGAQTAQSWFDNYVNKLQTQAGATFSPASGADAYSTAEDVKNQNEKAKQRAILEGLTMAGNSFFKP